MLQAGDGTKSPREGGVERPAPDKVVASVLQAGDGTESPPEDGVGRSSASRPLAIFIAVVPLAFSGDFIQGYFDIKKQAFWEWWILIAVDGALLCLILIGVLWLHRRSRAFGRARDVSAGGSWGRSMLRGRHYSLSRGAGTLWRTSRPPCSCLRPWQCSSRLLSAQAPSHSSWAVTKPGCDFSPGAPAAHRDPSGIRRKHPVVPRDGHKRREDAR